MMEMNRVIYRRADEDALIWRGNPPACKGDEREMPSDTRPSPRESRIN